MFKDFSRTTLDFQGPPTRSISSAQPLSSFTPPVPRPFFFSDWNLCFLCNLHVVLLMVTIYLAQTVCIIVYQADHYFISSVNQPFKQLQFRSKVSWQSVASLDSRRNSRFSVPAQIADQESRTSYRQLFARKKTNSSCKSECFIKDICIKLDFLQ